MNLDLEAAKTAQEIIKETDKKETKNNNSSEVENLVTKTLGVLQENGVYACMLYLYSRTSKSDKAVSKVTRERLIGMIELLDKNKKYNGDYKAGDVLKFLTDNICNDLDDLLLTKQLWEQILTYVRYGAKAGEE